MYIAKYETPEPSLTRLKADNSRRKLCTKLLVPVVEALRLLIFSG